VTWLRAGQPGFDARQGKIFLFTTTSRPALGAHPASYQMGTEVLSSGVKRLERKSNHSSVSRAKVKNARSYTSTPPCFCMA
jgi:hypothetical protein